MNAPLKISVISQDELYVRLHASFVRVIHSAPVENKLKVFRLMSRLAAEEIAIRRQQLIDDLWRLAQLEGLVDLVGEVWIQEWLADGFRPDPVGGVG
jgi:hypothetical protein